MVIPNERRATTRRRAAGLRLQQAIQADRRTGPRPDQGAGGTRKLTKFTIAPTWSPAGPGFWTRPAVRLHYSYATRNEAAQRAAAPESTLSDTSTFGFDRNGANFDMQFEYW
ncbi:hypothetical protein GCM10027514_19250 [Azotobacter armeniacus]